MADVPNVVIVTQFTTIPAQAAAPTPTPFESFSSGSTISLSSTFPSSEPVLASSTFSTLSTSRTSSFVESSPAPPPSSTPTQHVKDPQASPSPLILLYLAVSLIVLAFVIYGILVIIMMCRGRCSNCAAVEAQNRKLLGGEKVNGIRVEEFRAAEGRRSQKIGEFMGIWETICGIFGKAKRSPREQNTGADIDEEKRIASTQSYSYPYFNTTVESNSSTNDFAASRQTFATFTTQLPNHYSTTPSAHTESFSALGPRDSYTSAPVPDHNLTSNPVSPSIYSRQFNPSTASLYRSPEAAPHFNTLSSVNISKRYPELEGIPPTDPDYQTYINSKAIAEDERDPNHKPAQAHANAHLRAMRKRHPLPSQDQNRGQRVERVGGYGGFEDVPL